ncbi:acyltransferase [Grimontia sp. S25]|uniref:Acyltransferase n=1 Tax=Grimontia sedimenti TaxID=2711294 RepID=A0A6M1RL33_9GAMM|nr:acyltransferase [Grimontia sedimenti]NGO00123.1 acyltransferase [Grimontia sedimenti]
MVRIYNNSFSENRQLHVIFDFLRIICAIIVFLGHFRAVLAPTYSELYSPDIATKIFYFISGFGHQAVIIFFFFSGYFIHGTIKRGIDNNEFYFSYYLLNRFFRFFIVLLPVLIITFFLDSIALSYSSVYHLGEVDGSVPPKEKVDISLIIFIINLLSLQELIGSHFGSNSPLWSLSFEFVYYLLWPFIIFFFLKRSVFFPILVVFAIYLINEKVILLLPCWMIGALFYHYKVVINKYLSVIVFLTVLICTRFVTFGVLEDYALSLTFYLFVSSFSLYIRKSNVLKVGRIGADLAKISFPLYAVHMPIVGFTFFVIESSSPDNHMLICLLSIIVTVFISVILARMDGGHRTLTRYTIKLIGNKA